VTTTVSDLTTHLQAAVGFLKQGRAMEAATRLREAVARWPHSPDARRLLGLALRDAGDLAGAETQLRAALGLDAQSGPATVALCEVLLAAGKPDEALAAISPLADRQGADLNLITAQGDALKALGRRDDAAAVYERGARDNPRSGVAEHNLAATAGDLEQFDRAETAARRALAKGLDAPETWLVLGRALLGQGRHEEAVAALDAAIARRPEYVEAHGELAQIIWMTTEDVGQATRALDEAIRRHPEVQALALKKSELLDYAGDETGALAALADIISRPGADPVLHVAAARLLAKSDPARAVMHARIAAQALPDDYIAQSALCEACLAIGDAAAAIAIATRLRARMPENQHAIGLVATAWRLAGDERYEELYDYEGLVAASLIDTPPGWPSLDAFLADLTQSLAPLHTRRTHPIGQSLRHGSQTSQSLDMSKDPVIRAFFEAIDGPIRRRLATLGQGPDIVRARNTGAYAFNGVWSVRLRPHGFHADHLHPRGWLSSACYIALPDAVDRGREGWLKFGDPGVPTHPSLPAQHYIKPEPGLLALFPSYMWHGTVPFGGDEPRLTIAFDLIPA
jgi:tetratricopeptide (TPR) repeat protein